MNGHVIGPLSTNGATSFSESCTVKNTAEKTVRCKYKSCAHVNSRHADKLYLGELQDEMQNGANEIGKYVVLPAVCSAWYNPLSLPASSLAVQWRALSIAAP